jgi:hypothetical protein
MNELKINHYYLIRNKERWDCGLNVRIEDEYLVAKIITIERCSILLEFTRDIKGHNGGEGAVRTGKDGHCWYVNPEVIIKEIPFNELMVYEL